jgi:Trypsin-like peptidase domain
MSGGSPVRVDRVVAVAATLRDGRDQVGSGYLVSGRLALTAEHCTRDKVTGEPAAQLRVVRASDGAVADVAGVVSDDRLDVAVLQLAGDAPWDADLPPPSFARVDQSQTGVLDDCTGIGFPLFQRDPGRRTRHTSEFHGRVYQTDERESGRLLMREPLIHPGPVTGPEGEAVSGRGEEGPSPWGGLSGALMFYRGSAIGVVVEHHPRQGPSTLLAIGFERIARSAKIRLCLRLSGPDSLPWVSEQDAVRLVLAGWPLAEVTDPFALEVHRPVQPEASQPWLPDLPTYVRRDHDTELGSVVRAAAEGRSGIAVLVGGSSTGKTRACWEALQLLRDRPERWRLWHPIDPTRPDAALRELPAIGPRTVVWLNEAHLYLDVADGGLGEQVAAGLRELLRNPARAPVLVLATLWPQYWDGLTAHPTGGADPHAQARELLAAQDITVLAAVTATQLQQFSATADARLSQAAATARDGQVIQFLAGAPELLARYRNAPPAAAALICAAMDARRLGMGVGLPHAFLEEAAPGYLTNTEWDAVGEDWLKDALAYAVQLCKGVPGPLTRIHPRPARSRGAGSGSGGDARVVRAAVSRQPAADCGDSPPDSGRGLCGR